MAEPTAQEQFSGTKPVEDKHRIDEAALYAWAKANVEGFEGPMEVRQFKGGQSNPTYQLVTPARKYVLRRKPPGKLLASAHAVDREYRVIAALYPTGFPVARPFGLCQDESILGTVFYVMDMVEGRIIWDGAVPDVTPADRTAIYNAQVETLAQLHNQDHEAIGLAEFGKPGNYFARQIHRWTKQYRDSQTQSLESMDRLIDWLAATVPDDDKTTVVHGDYRLDNMILHPTENRVLAVLDWELSTLGNPLADFSYLLMNWVMAPEGGRSGLAGLDLKALGIPSIEEMVEVYCAKTGRTSLPNLDWYFAYNLFRLAAICQGIAGRVRDGTASSPHALQMGARVPLLADGALQAARRAGL
ncbi:MAG: phosphotransferase family protein [Caulobacterales bacterium]|jgi:aminoglycoside phosphotransferase (APT) family kinase protein